MRELVDPNMSQTEELKDIVELRIPSKAEWVGVARLAVAGVANRMNLSIEDIEDLKLAVAEACTNCIQHAGDSDEVRLSCEILPSHITITVDDHPNGFAGRELTPQESAEPQVGGLGVFLIRSLMDDVSYKYDPDSGTKLIMTKHLKA